MKTTAEPAGANCATGGVKLELGRDLDHNGMLDASEIDPTLTRYVCDGVQGTMGSIGLQGPPGAQGPQGPVGPQGAPGTPGKDGAQGPQGAPGTPGKDGAQGPQGDPGTPGKDGAQGPQGAPGAPGQSVVVEILPPGDPTCPAGGSKFTASNGTTFACNGVDQNTVLNAGATPPTSCSDILNNGGSRGSGVYRIDPNGGSSLDAFLVYCDMTTSGGGWTLVMNVNPSDGDRVGFTNTTFWQANAEYGDFTSHFTNDYKSPASFTVAGTNVMVQVAQPGATGSVIGWKAWTMPLKTFDTFFDAAPNTVQTTAVIDSNVSAVYTFEPLIRFGQPMQPPSQLVSNRAINLNGDRVRLGASNYTTGDDNSPGLGTQMNETSCGVGNNCWHHHDVELVVNSTTDVVCTPPTIDGTFKWIGTDGGCGPSCSCNIDGQYAQTWTYRIYVR